MKSTWPFSPVVPVLLLIAAAAPASAQVAEPSGAVTVADVYSEYAVGVYKKSIGEVFEAVDHLEFAWRNSGHDHRVGMALAESYYLLKNFTRCEMVLDETLDANENDRDALMLKAKVRYIKRDRRSAVICLERVREHHPGTFEAERLLGNITYEMGEHDKALEAYRRCLSIDAAYPYIQYRYGRLLAEQGRFDEAETAYRRAVHLDPSFTDAALELSGLLGGSGRVEDAIAALESAMEHGSDDPELATALVQLYSESGRYDDGIALLERREESSGLSRDGEMLLGRMYFEQGRFEDAKRVFSKRFEKEPESAELARILAEIHLKSGDPGRARNYFERSIAISPGDYRGYLGLFFASSVRFTSAAEPIDLTDEECASLLEEASRLVSGGGFDGNYMVGLAYLSVDSLDAALRHLLRAREERGDDRGTLLNLANVYEKQRRFELAAEQLARLHALDPDDPTILNFYGYVLAEMGRDLDRAERMIRRALETDPENGYYLDSLGWVYYQKGDFNRAVATLERAISRLNEDPVVLEHLGDAYAALRYFDKAITAYERSNRLQGGNDAILEKIESATQQR